MQPVVFLSGLVFAVVSTASPISNTGPGLYDGYIAESNEQFSSSLVKRVTGGIEVCNGANFTAPCDHVAWPLDECIALNGYAGLLESFRPDEGNECYLMQGRCNAELPYADLYWNSTGLGNLGLLSFIKQVESYICMTPLEL